MELILFYYFLLLLNPYFYNLGCIYFDLFMKYLDLRNLRPVVNHLISLRSYFLQGNGRFHHQLFFLKIT